MALKALEKIVLGAAWRHHNGTFLHRIIDGNDHCSEVKSSTLKSLSDSQWINRKPGFVSITPLGIKTIIAFTKMWKLEREQLHLMQIDTNKFNVCIGLGVTYTPRPL